VSPRTLIPAIQRAIADVDKTLPTFSVATMSDMIELSMGRLSFVMTNIGVTATVALLLAAIGLFGVLAYIVSPRSREISVRLAMGAMPASVARLVTRQGALLAISGVAVGVIEFLASSRLLQTALVGVGRSDVLAIVVVASVLMAIALAASWIPARRAARVDPARALTASRTTQIGALLSEASWSHRLQPAVFLLPAIQRLFGHTQPAHQVCDFRARVPLLQRLDDLFFRESTLPHGSSRA
jgi:hypothetical protein